jgi:hypothetical protein
MGALGRVGAVEVNRGSGHRDVGSAHRCPPDKTRQNLTESDMGRREDEKR